MKNKKQERREEFGTCPNILNKNNNTTDKGKNCIIIVHEMVTERDGANGIVK